MKTTFLYSQINDMGDTGYPQMATITKHNTPKASTKHSIP